ncbi:unnamed protein product [Rangifer tarandus platyrhynchus]|uniref:Uncharacterized protein n=1 Tax=Rangifer tarandus platyrhynchus TaxID=3082113 RepID=A0ABN9A4S6_RANTA|nr:unnamed protein product [Rangifer tarandus platyrhynchus]CAI9181282.1 unnamed protein product [Rangifer tarandus platyrhynchus]
MAIGVWQLLLDMGILSSVDQHLYFQDTYVFYQISSDECNYLYWEFEGEEAWQNGVRLLLQLVPLIPSRAGICELSHQKIEDSEESSDEILACLISAIRSCDFPAQECRNTEGSWKGGFSKNGFRPSLEIRSRPFFFSRASPQAQKKKTLGPRMILHSRPKTITPIQKEVAREIQCSFPHSLMISGSGMKESLGLEKKATVSKVLAESSNFRENKTEL